MLSTYARVKSRRSHEAHVRVLSTTTATTTHRRRICPHDRKRGRVAVPRCPQRLAIHLLPRLDSWKRLSRDVAFCTCGCCKKCGGAPQHDLEKRVQKQGTCSLRKVRSATPCMCVDARSCNCNDNLLLRSLPIHVSDWKNFNARSSHKRLQHSSAMSGETISTMVVCFAVPSCPF